LRSSLRGELRMPREDTQWSRILRVRAGEKQESSEEDALLHIE